MEYTEKIHAKKLLWMLSQDDPYSLCPSKHMPSACKICLSFIGLKQIDTTYFLDKPSILKCPCYQLGKKEAIKRTWLSLKEKGYIKMNFFIGLRNALIICIPFWLLIIWLIGV